MRERGEAKGTRLWRVELAVRAMFCIGLVVEAAVGEWSAQTFVEE
jgi:hypothetical protein